MRTALIAITCLFFLAGCSSAPEPATEPQNSTLVKYEVFGMDCPGCHGGLENLALKIPGVYLAKASWENNKLELGIEEGANVTDEQIQDAIDRANFTAGERLK